MRTTDKPFNITKMQVYEAYKAVKSNQGAAGVDKETIEQFEANLKGNLYKLWNRMSSEKLLSAASTCRLHSQEVWRDEDRPAAKEKEEELEDMVAHILASLLQYYQMTKRDEPLEPI